MDSKRLELLSNKSRYIFIDIDGTVLASNDAICTLLNKKYHKHYKGADVMDWNYTDLYPTNSTEIEELYESEDFFNIVKFIKGAKTYLTNHREKIILITKGSTKNFIRKRWWFNQMGFSDVPIIPIPLDMSKHIIDMRNCLFIDDVTSNLNDVNAKWKVQFMEYNDNKERSWQTEWKGERLYKW